MCLIFGQEIPSVSSYRRHGFRSPATYNHPASPRPMNNTMQAVWISTYGGPEVLEIRTVGKPLINDEQVLVRVRASSLNRADLLQRQGKYPPPPGFPVKDSDATRPAAAQAMRSRNPQTHSPPEQSKRSLKATPPAAQTAAAKSRSSWLRSSHLPPTTRKLNSIPASAEATEFSDTRQPHSV